MLNIIELWNILSVDLPRGPVVDAGVQGTAIPTDFCTDIVVKGNPSTCPQRNVIGGADQVRPRIGCVPIVQSHGDTHLSTGPCRRAPTTGIGYISKGPRLAGGSMYRPTICDEWSILKRPTGFRGPIVSPVAEILPLVVTSSWEQVMPSAGVCSEVLRPHCIGEA